MRQCEYRYGQEEVNLFFGYLAMILRLYELYSVELYDDNDKQTHKLDRNEIN